MNLLDLQRKLIRLTGGVLTRGTGFEAAPPEPKARQFAGLRVMVENPAGSARSGISRTGQRWSVRMNNDYGFLPRATGADGEGLDVFLGPDENAPDVHVVHQNDPWSGRYDEDKVMMGFRSPDEAKAAYLSNYDRPGFFRSMTILPMAAFRAMLTNGEAGGVQWKRKHGREHAAGAMFAAGEGRWVTIGSVKDAPRGEKGGTPVYIGKDGTIEAGPQKLEGRNVSNLKEPAKPKEKATPAPHRPQPMTSEQLHERVKQLRAAGKPTDLAVAQARREERSTPAAAPTPEAPTEVRGGPHAEIEAKYGPAPGERRQEEDPPLPPSILDDNPEQDAQLERARAINQKHGFGKVSPQQHNQRLEQRTRELMGQGLGINPAYAQAKKEMGPRQEEESEKDLATVIPKPQDDGGEPIPSPQAAEPKATATPPVKEKPKAAKPRGEPAAIPPQELRRRILERYDQENGRGIPEEAWDLMNGMQDPWTFARSDGLKGERNTMLREGGKEGAAMARSGAVKVAARGGAEDAIAELKDRYGPEGEDLYWRMAKSRAGSGFDDALKYARQHEDPEMRFLAALHDITPSRKADRVPQEKVQADQLPLDHEFKVQGVPVKVTENADGEKVLVDHDALPETPVDALGEVPVDKGSMKESELPDVGGAGDDPFGDLPPDEDAGETPAPSGPAKPLEQAVEQHADASDGQHDQARDKLGEDAAPGAGHEQNVPREAPASDTGVFGQEILRPATGKNQGGLFHEPVDVARKEGERVGSASANDPRNTAQMFPAPAETEKPAQGAPSAVAAAVASPPPASTARGSGIDDFGEKIGGARKDTSKPLGPRAPKEVDEEQKSRPAWARHYDVAENAGRSGKKFFVKHGKSIVYEGGRPAEFDTKEEAEKAMPGLIARDTHRVHQTKDKGPNGETLYGIHRKLGDRKFPLVQGGFKSAQEAEDHLRAKPEKILNHEFKFPTKPWLANVERQGAPRRKGNVAPKDFQQAFGFRGGEFGNWNKGEGGQQALDHAYDALHDLSDALKLPPQAVSLNGGLAIAFGARGHGGKDAGSAHYEPDKKVINLTKIHGAGSLAHEWFHALDHYLHDSTNPQPDSGREKGFASRGFPFKHTGRAELAAAFKNVVDTMTRKEAEKPIDQRFEGKKAAGQEKYLREHLDQIKRDMQADRSSYNKRWKKPTPEQLKRFDSITEQLVSGGVGEKKTIASSRPGSYKARYTFDPIEQLSDLHKEVTGRGINQIDEHSAARRLYWQVEGLRDARKRMGEAEQGAKETKRIATDYFDEARFIDNHRASDYWATPHELAARAFESYVHDKIARGGGKSQYLVHGVENKYYAALGMKPYPEGEERSTINAAFDHLLSVLKHEQHTDDSGTTRTRVFSADEAA